MRMCRVLRLKDRDRAEGITRAKARGVMFGRPPKLTPHQRAEARARLRADQRWCSLAVEPEAIHALPPGYGVRSRLYGASMAWAGYLGYVGLCGLRLPPAFLGCAK